MELIGKKWITCTPVAFRGDEKTFFSRDSGLCCRTLQSMGAEVKVIMPEPAWDDESDVIRVPYERLEKPEFWREQKVDAVILYSWAAPAYTAIAEAIHASGTKLYLNMDTGGLISPFVEPFAYGRTIWMSERQKLGMIKGGLLAIIKIVGSGIRLDRHLSRLRHMAAADVIGVVTPIGANRMRRYARFFGRRDIEDKICFVPHPVDREMLYKGEDKQRKVIAIGRWDDHVQKRPHVLIDVCCEMLLMDPDVKVVIAGKDAVSCGKAIEERLPVGRDRVVGHERLEHAELSMEMKSSQVLLCVSRYEAFFTVGGEALLAGCTLVSPASPSLPSSYLYCDDGRSGRLARDKSISIAKAVVEELDAWASGKRDPVAISSTWRKRIGADMAIKRVDELLFVNTGSPGDRHV